MQIRQNLIFAITLIAAPFSAHADAVAYVINGAQQFGTVDLETGNFTQGPTPSGGSLGYFGLAPGPGGSLLTFLYNGDVDSINPATGAATLLGPSGLGDCSVVGVSPCPPTSVFTMGNVGGKIYATDFANDLYSIDPVTGAASLIALSVIPPAPFVLGSQNPDGTLNFADEALFGANGSLYATFDAFVFDPTNFMPASITVAPQLYRIDPSTGAATVIGPTDLGIGAVVGANGTYYGFNDLASQIESLNLSTGSTSFVTSCNACDASLFGVIQGAAPVPEPTPGALVALGIAGLAVMRRMRRR